MEKNDSTQNKSRKILFGPKRLFSIFKTLTKKSEKQIIADREREIEVTRWINDINARKMERNKDHGLQQTQHREKHQKNDRIKIPSLYLPPSFVQQEIMSMEVEKPEIHTDNVTPGRNVAIIGRVVKNEDVEIVHTLPAEEKAAIEYSIKRQVSISSQKELWEDTFTKWSNFHDINAVPKEIEECLSLMELLDNQQIGQHEWEEFQAFVHLKLKDYARFDALHDVRFLPHRVLAKCLLGFLLAMLSNRYYTGEDNQCEKYWAIETRELIRVISGYIEIPEMRRFTIFP